MKKQTDQPGGRGFCTGDRGQTSASHRQHSVTGKKCEAGSHLKGASREKEGENAFYLPRGLGTRSA